MEKMEPGSAKVVVKLVVEITVEAGAWGPDTTVQAAVDRATAEATDRLEELLDKDDSVWLVSATAARVVCEAATRS